jgi:hypothetical protein
MIRTTITSLLGAAALAIATAGTAEAAPSVPQPAGHQALGGRFGIGVGVNFPIHPRPRYSTHVHTVPVVTYQQVPIYQQVFVGYDSWGRPIFQQVITGYQTVPVNTVQQVVHHGPRRHGPTVNVGFGLGFGRRW